MRFRHGNKTKVKRTTNQEISNQKANSTADAHIARNEQDIGAHNNVETSYERKCLKHFKNVLKIYIDTISGMSNLEFSEVWSLIMKLRQFLAGRLKYRLTKIIKGQIREFTACAKAKVSRQQSVETGRSVFLHQEIYGSLIKS